MDADVGEEKVTVVHGDLTPPSRSFYPLALISQWDENITTCPMATVAIVLPSGVGAGDFKIQVIEDGDVLELTVTWPTPLVDIEEMHLKWLKCDDSGKPISTEITRHHPKILGFQKKLRMIREHFNKTPESVARFGLPFTVQPQPVSQYNLGWKNNTCRMVYVDLRSISNNYASINDSKDFEEH